MMSSERHIVRALDFLTKGGLESQAPDEVKAAVLMRDVLGSKNLIGVGVAEKTTNHKPTGKLALCFYVKRKVSLKHLKASEAVPPAVPTPLSRGSAIGTDVVVLGKMRLDAVSTQIHPGDSIGHVTATFGTLGAVVTRRGKLYLLSNSHVLARSGKAKLKDPILSPGRTDGGKNPRDLVARLAAFKKFVKGGTFVNKADCAIATPVAGRLTDINPAIPGIGIPKGIQTPRRGMKIVKVGRASGKTFGVIRDVHFRFVFQYDGIGEVGFVDQVLCTRYSIPGDSGSLVLDRKTKRAVGLHFASAPNGSVFSPIDAVMNALHVELVTKSGR
jgi:hypothetical protein